jgi:hypothetical protein
MASHTATGEWKSFEIRMRRRRAERLLLRAEAAVDAGCLDEARASLDEARTLWPTAPGLPDVEAKLETHTITTAAGSRRRVAWKEVVAAVAAVLFVATAAIVILDAGWRKPLRARDPKVVIAPVSAEQAKAIPQTHGADPQQNHDAVSAASTNREAATEPAVAEPEPSLLVSRSPAAAPPIDERRSTIPEVRSSIPDLRPPISDLRSLTSDVRPPTDGITVQPTAPAVGSAAPISVPAPTEPVPVPTVVATTGASLPTAAETALPQPPQEALIRGVLARYAEAYDDLDVAAAERVWPSLNRSALTHAFDALEWQQVSLGQCSIQVDGNAARASCAGHAVWTPKVGGRQHDDARRWTFDLEKSAGGWLIRNARVQNR